MVSENFGKMTQIDNQIPEATMFNLPNDQLIESEHKIISRKPSKTKQLRHVLTEGTEVMSGGYSLNQQKSANFLEAKIN